MKAGKLEGAFLRIWSRNPITQLSVSGIRTPRLVSNRGRLLVRPSNFILLGMRCICCPAAPRKPACRKQPPRTPACPEPPFDAHKFPTTIQLLVRLASLSGCLRNRALTLLHVSVHSLYIVWLKPSLPPPPRFLGLRLQCGGGFVSGFFQGGLGHICRGPQILGETRLRV